MFTANIYLAFPALCGYAQEAHCGNVLILEHVYLRKQKQNIRLIENYRRTLLNYKEVKDKYISHGAKRIKFIRLYYKHTYKELHEKVLLNISRI